MYVGNYVEDFTDFFGETNIQANKPAENTLFHQLNPIRRCRLTWGRGCRNHKCSSECRKRWASKESLVLRRHLHSLSENIYIYFGELTTIGDLTAAQHKKIRTKFQTSLTKLGKERSGSVKLLAVSEVGSNGRIHYHHCLVSDFEVRQRTIKKLWSEAATGWRTIVSHAAPRSIEARVKYMFKDMKEPGNVRLFRKGSPRITFGHLDFYPEGKAAIWREFVNELKGKQHGQSECSTGEPDRGDEPGREEVHDQEAHAVPQTAHKWRPDLE